MAKIIILDNKKCRIVSDDTDLLKKLHHYLSFKLTGIEYTPAYQNGWSGITYLLSKANKFNYGLLHKVEEFLSDKNVAYTVEDRRVPKIIVPELSIEESLKKHKLIPRDHQIRICQAANTND